ncbi:hypothetical protein BJ546DRAFT_54001 [Cryomyces antarcticus]
MLSLFVSPPSYKEPAFSEYQVPSYQIPISPCCLEIRLSIPKGLDGVSVSFTKRALPSLFLSTESNAIGVPARTPYRRPRHSSRALIVTKLMFPGVCQTLTRASVIGLNEKQPLQDFCMDLVLVEQETKKRPSLSRQERSGDDSDWTPPTTLSVESPSPRRPHSPSLVDTGGAATHPPHNSPLASLKTPRAARQEPPHPLPLPPATERPSTHIPPIELPPNPPSSANPTHAPPHPRRRRLARPHARRPAAAPTAGPRPARPVRQQRLGREQVQTPTAPPRAHQAQTRRLPARRGWSAGVWVGEGLVCQMFRCFLFSSSCTWQQSRPFVSARTPLGICTAG